MTTNGKKPIKPEDELAENESRFVSETTVGLTVDNSEAEGEPLDFGLVDEDDE